MVIAIIVSVAVLAFLIALVVIYFDNIKNYLAKKKKSKNKTEQKPQTQPKQEIKIEEFIPLKNQYDDEGRDASLDALFADEEKNQSNESFSFDEDLKEEVIKEQQKIENTRQHLLDREFRNVFEKDISLQKSSSKTTIAEQIQNLPPELKALILDSTLKKRDDV